MAPPGATAGSRVAQARRTRRVRGRVDLTGVSSPRWGHDPRSSHICAYGLRNLYSADDTRSDGAVRIRWTGGIRKDAPLGLCCRGGRSGSRAFSAPAFAAPADLDSSFDGDGKNWVDLAGTNEQTKDVAVQADGKPVVVGQTGVPSQQFYVLRFTTSGALDPTFDGDGIVTITFPSSTSGSANDVAIQATSS